MKKLDKQTINERDALQVRLQSLQEALEQAIEAYNEAIGGELWVKVEQARDAYNEAIDEANAWRESVANEIQSYIDGRSEKWLEGDKGQEYRAWCESYEETIERVELEQPEGLGLGFEDRRVSELLGDTAEEIQA